MVSDFLVFAILRQPLYYCLDL